MKIADLKRDIDERFEQVNERFEQVNVRFESVDARFDRLETAVVTGLETTRRHMDVLIEQLRADARLWLEGFDLRQQQDARAALPRAEDTPLSLTLLRPAAHLLPAGSWKRR